MIRRTLIVLVAFTLLMPVRTIGQCTTGSWGAIGGGVVLGSGFTNTFAVAGVGSQFQVLTEPTSGAASLYAAMDIGLEIKKIMAIGGSSAWASDGTSIWCFDRINAASNPLRLQSVFTPPGGIRDFILVGFTVYVWQGTTLSVIDYSNTAAPVLSATIQLPQTPFQAAFLNNRLYLLSSSRTVQILDVTVPASPAFIRSLSLGGTNLVTQSTPAAQPGGGTLVHFAFYQTGITIGSNVIRIIDIDNDQLTGAGGSVAISGTPVQISGNFMLQTQSLMSINWANPLAPTFSTIYSDASSRFRAAGFVTSSGVTRAFIAGSEGGMLAVNTNTGALQNRYQPQPGAVYESAMFPATGTLYIADGLDGLRTASISDAGPGSRSIAFTGGIASSSSFTQVACGDNFVVTTNGTTVPYYSTVFPGSPVLIGTYSPSGTVEDLAASGGAGFVVRNASGVRQLDMVNFLNSSPFLQGNAPVPADFPNAFRRVRAFGGVVVTVAALDCRLFSFSAPTPVNLTARGVITIGANLQDTAIAGNTLYLLDFDGHIHVYNISNLDAPVFVRTVSCAASRAGMAASGDWIGIVGSMIDFVNISDRSNPITVNSAALPNVCTNVAAAAGPSGPHFLVSANGCGVRAFAAPTDWSPQITDEPDNTSACLGGTAMFSVAALAPNTPGNPTTYQWNRIGTGGGPIPGEGSPTLMISNASPADAAFTYVCVVSNSCGQATSAAASLAICRADINCSGNVSVQDIFDFLGFFFAESPQADFNGQSGITVQDLFDFLAAFFAGCA